MPGLMITSISIRWYLIIAMAVIVTKIPSVTLPIGNICSFPKAKRKFEIPPIMLIKRPINRYFNWFFSRGDGVLLYLSASNKTPYKVEP